jgi:hypothetical protein
MGAGGICQQIELAFLFQVLLKCTLTCGEGRPRKFPPNNEQVCRGMGHRQATFMNPKLFLLLAPSLLVLYAQCPPFRHPQNCGRSTAGSQAVLTTPTQPVVLVQCRETQAWSLATLSTPAPR